MGRAAVAPLPPEGGGGSVVGSYTGTEHSPQAGYVKRISLGFQPKMVLVRSPAGAHNGVSSWGGQDLAIAFVGIPFSERYSSNRIVITENGFQIEVSQNNAAQWVSPNYTYHYIAFR